MNGGGLYCQNGPSFTLESGATVIEDNSATRGAGLFFMSAASCMVKDSALLEIKNNAATSSGGGVFVDGADSSFSVRGEHTKLIIAANSAVMQGGGLYCQNGPSFRFENRASVIVSYNKLENKEGCDDICCSVYIQRIR